MDNQVTKEEDTVDLRVLWDVFAKRWYVIIILALLIGFGSGVYATMTYVPKYSSSVSFLLHSDDALGQVTVDDVDRYAGLTKTYALALIYNKSFCATLNEKAGTSEMYTDSQVASMMSYSQVLEGTPTLKITVTSTDPIASYNIAMQVMLLANEELAKNFNIGTMDVFNLPEISVTPVNKDPFIKMMALGFAVGAVLIYALYLIRTLTDTVVHGESSLEGFTDCPILGVVPTFDKGSSAKTRSKGLKSGR